MPLKEGRGRRRGRTTGRTRGRRRGRTTGNLNQQWSPCKWVITMTRTSERLTRELWRIWCWVASLTSTRNQDGLHEERRHGEKEREEREEREDRERREDMKEGKREREKEGTCRWIGWRWRTYSSPYWVWRCWYQESRSLSLSRSCQQLLPPSLSMVNLGSAHEVCFHPSPHPSFLHRLFSYSEERPSSLVRKTDDSTQPNVTTKRSVQWKEESKPEFSLKFWILHWLLKEKLQSFKIYRW